MSGARAQTRAALVEARTAARSAWRREYSAAIPLAVVVLLLPWWAPGWIEIDTLASWVYLALAAAGL